MQEKIIITEQNIEEMCRLAEDVMRVLYMNYFYYDEEGNERAWPEDAEKKAAIYDDPLSRLLYNLFRRGDKLEDVRDYTQKDVIPWVEPILHKAIQLFRKGTGGFGETSYVAAENISDDYLIALFAREVRNMMMIFAGQIHVKESAQHYLLMIGHPACTDGDQWYGIYFDNQQLKYAYGKAVEKLEQMKKESSYYQSFQVSIWEFIPEEKTYADDWEPNKEQIIRKVEPKELRCFR